jgi:hypothetical protein
LVAALPPGLGELHPSKSHHIVELKARCAKRDDRRRSPTDPATTLWITLAASILGTSGRSYAAAAFVKTPAHSETAGSRILYNSTTGALSYHADGLGGAAPIRFATLSTGLALTDADFKIV